MTSLPMVNIQALLALGLFLCSLLIARLVVRIANGSLPGGRGWVIYLRTLLGFLLAAAITLAFYSFAGVDVLSGRL
ncbi:MAG TPA: flagellar biosynthesis protein FliR [Synergistaceae bacterium]|nr:flagellar biosynthesis protein FliR [Synergistaceae bacterium]